jgi:tricorn protease
MDVIKIVNIETKTTEAITEKWYGSGYPSFSADGKYLLFTSQRDFSPVYSRTEWNHAYINTYRVYMTMLDKATPSPFAPENQDVKPLDKKEDENEEKDEKTGKEAIVDIDFDGIRSRIVALPIDPANYYNINCVDGKVYYIRRYQNKEEGAGLFVFDLDKEKETLLGDYNYTLSADNKKMLVGKNSTWDVIDLPSFAVNIEEAVDLSNMKMHIDYKAEWQQIFDEAWRQMRDFFYVENMHGQDWKGIYDKYSSLVPYVNHRNDLNYIIGEMIGELNAGHAYVNTGDKTQPKRIQTGLLGANIEAHESGYFRIAEILDGAPWSEKMNSPLQSPGVDVSEGDYILEIDRKSTKEVDNIYQLLVGKADKTVELLVNETPGTEGAEKILVKPISDESELKISGKWKKQPMVKSDTSTYLIWGPTV